MDAKGRFDGDPFEQLYVKVDKDAKLLTVVVETGETIPFHLTKRAYAFEDVEDPTTFILDYHHNMIIFKVTRLAAASSSRSLSACLPV